MSLTVVVRYSTSPAPCCGSKQSTAAYLNLSPAALDLLRARGDVRPLRVPSLHHNGEALRVPLLDIRDLDRLIESWKAGGLS